ncbi:MAG TPA: hypothetical protein VG733_13045 [Chthoniobacteraceae bacterium]|nr:hypothetical protein [Chthoniobacteraceae bacterium]
MRHFLIPLALSLAILVPVYAQDASPAASPAKTMSEADKKLATECLSQAKQIALGCRLYAADNHGKFPDKIEQLIPDYITDATLFVSPLSPKKEAMGFEYFGKGGTDSDAPDKILVRSKDLTADGRRIVVYYDCSGKIVADKQ